MKRNNYDCKVGHGLSLIWQHSWKWPNNHLWLQNMFKSWWVISLEAMHLESFDFPCHLCHSHLHGCVFCFAVLLFVSFCLAYVVNICEYSSNHAWRTYCYNTANCLSNTHHRPSYLAHEGEVRGEGCLSWVDIKTDIVWFWLLLCFMHYRVIFDRVIARYYCSTIVSH